jgi:hypothetical protein
MSDENEIKKELLQQMKNSGNTSVKNTTVLGDILTKDARRVKRMKWIAVFTWLIFGMLFTIGGVVELFVGAKGNALNPRVPVHGFRSELPPQMSVTTTAVPIIAVTLRALLLIAIIFTVSFYIRSRTLTMRQIQMRLSAIEEAIRKIT